MERFNDLRELKESKDNIIDKMSQLTDEQKTIAKDFFNRHNAYEREVDWNKWRTLTWEDLEKVIKKDRSMSSKSQVKKSIKKGLEGFIQDLDYGVIAEGELDGSPWVAYQPYTWEASRMIASDSVEPTSTVGEWCTAFQKDDFYWLHHTHEEDYSAFIYLCGETIPYGKVAIEINDHKNTNCDGLRFRYTMNGIHFNIWDSEDKRMTAKTGAKEVRQIVTEEMLRKALESLKEKYARDEELSEERRGRDILEAIEKVRSTSVGQAVENRTLKVVGDVNEWTYLCDYEGGDLDFNEIGDYNIEVDRIGRTYGWENVRGVKRIKINTWKGDLVLHDSDLYHIKKVDGNCIIWVRPSQSSILITTSDFSEVTGNLMFKNDGKPCGTFLIVGELVVGGKVTMDDFMFEDLIEGMGESQLLVFLDKIQTKEFKLRERLREHLKYN